MYEFHYDYILKKFPGKARLLFTDTDSLMYLIMGKDVPRKMHSDRSLFDFSSYDKSSPFYDPKNSKVFDNILVHFVLYFH